MTNSDDPEKAASNPEEETKKAKTEQKSDATESPEQMEVGSPAKIPALAKTTASSPSEEESSKAAAASSSSVTPEPSKPAADCVEFKVIYNKKKHDIRLPLDTDIGSLKTHLQPIIEIPPAMMKVMIKGLAKDDSTLAQLGVNKGSKVLVVGSSLTDVLQVSAAPKKDPKKSKDEQASGGSTSSESQKQKLHKRVLEKGKPDDAMAGVKGVKAPLPLQPISGMLNKHGSKVRLTFKLEEDQVWIGTKDRTEKLPLNSIRNVLSEPIEGHEEYHIVALQLGTTEVSRYWIYWVPAQYVESIKDAILGKWSAFH